MLGLRDMLRKLYMYACVNALQKKSYYILHFINFSVMGSPLVMDPNSICRRSKPSGGANNELCQTQPEIIQEVAKGARLGMRECQHQFRHHRWNCTGHGKNLGKILQQGKAHFH